MERYYTRPIEIGLYANTRHSNHTFPASFYGLSFVRVVFKYGVDYDFCLCPGRCGVAQQNVTLPGNVVPQIQQNSGTGEIYRYQVAGPPHLKIANLRTVQDWVDARARLLTIPGIVAVNSWGGPTKEFDVQVDPQKLEAHNLTVPQIITALGNANINVGGREITIGQQSINIRGVGLINDGGDDDLTKGYKAQRYRKRCSGPKPTASQVTMKDIAKVTIGNRPRLGICGRDDNDDVVAAIVVMSRTETTADMIPKIKEAVDKMNVDGSLPPGVKIISFYVRSNLIAVTTHTVLHNLTFRMHPDISDSMDFSWRPLQRHHCWLKHPLRIVFRGHHHRDAWRKREPAFSQGGRSRHHRGLCGNFS